MPAFVFATAVAALVLGLAITAFMAYIYVSYSGQTSAYDSAAVCASTRAIANCRFEGTAALVAKRTDNGDLLVDVVFADLPGKTYTAYFTSKDSSFWQTLRQGSSAQAELWQGNVTRLAGAKTSTNPDELPNTGLLAVAVFGTATLAVLVVFIWLLWLNRRAAAAKATP